MGVLGERLGLLGLWGLMETRSCVVLFVLDTGGRCGFLGGVLIAERGGL